MSTLSEAQVQTKNVHKQALPVIVVPLEVAGAAIGAGHNYYYVRRLAGCFGSIFVYCVRLNLRNKIFIVTKRRIKMRYTSKEKYRILNLLQKYDKEFISERYHISVRTLYRWKSKFDGTVSSLDNKSSRPLTLHPNAHTFAEIQNIYALLRRNPYIGLNELYGKLRLNYGYTRNPVSLYRFLKKNGYYTNRSVRKPYKPKPYITPLYVGEKMQLDVKYVPYECFTVRSDHSVRFYQYTIIDEATRERFIYPYKECNGNTTVDFLTRAFKYFGYIPRVIQTDNGSEFTYTMQTDKIHILDRFCIKYGIEHKLIRPRTPRHNGKVERSHRNDNERFYRYFKFYSFDDLRKQMLSYLKRSNNIPVTSLKWLTPIEKRKELFAIKLPGIMLNNCKLY